MRRGRSDYDQNGWYAWYTRMPFLSSIFYTQRRITGARTNCRSSFLGAVFLVVSLAELTPLSRRVFMEGAAFSGPGSQKWVQNLPRHYFLFIKCCDPYIYDFIKMINLYRGLFIHGKRRAQGSGTWHGQTVARDRIEKATPRQARGEGTKYRKENGGVLGRVNDGCWFGNTKIIKSLCIYITFT